MQKKDNKCGKIVREMDWILLRDWINRRITESQSRHINWFGMYAVNNNNIGTCTSYLSVVCYRDLVLHFSWPSLGDWWLWGSAFLLRVFLLWGSGHLGQVLYNHPAVVLQPFFLTWTTSPCYSNLFNVSWVGTDNKGQLKAVVRSQKH